MKTMLLTIMMNRIPDMITAKVLVNLFDRSDFKSKSENSSMIFTRVYSLQYFSMESNCLYQCGFVDSNFLLVAAHLFTEIPLVNFFQNGFYIQNHSRYIDGGCHMKCTRCRIHNKMNKTRSKIQCKMSCKTRHSARFDW